jgi:hypothetical protein
MGTLRCRRAFSHDSLAKKIVLSYLISLYLHVSCETCLSQQTIKSVQKQVFCCTVLGSRYIPIDCRTERVMEAFVKSIKSSLECPVCMSIPRDAIFQCNNGHLLCKDCNEKLDVCPTCRDELPTPGEQTINTGCTRSPYPP